MDDCLIVGAGVVGLSLAYELSGRGVRVHLVDRRLPGKEASWAGAGILPAAVLRPGDSAYQQLSGLSHDLHPKWAAELRAETGIDTGFRRCGDVCLARDASEAEALADEVAVRRGQGIAVEALAIRQLAALEPALAERSAAKRMTACYRIADAAQLRNPHHLQALVAACSQRGVRITTNAEATNASVRGHFIREVQTSAGAFRAGCYCFTAGAWSGRLLATIGCVLPVKPIRGQMVLLRLDQQGLGSVVHAGRHYLVPREDGRVLVGSTLEDVGFDRRTTAAAIAELLNVATSIMPRLATAEVERCWAGLRPGSPGSQPFIGRLPAMDNAYLAAGHFRWGLYLSPGTAVVLSELMCGQTPSIDLDAFRLDRRHEDLDVCADGQDVMSGD
jgi:glycine oxidase